MTEDGSECHSGEVGRLVVKLPTPPGFASTLWRADERFKKVYFSKVPVRRFTSSIFFKLNTRFDTELLWILMWAGMA